MGDENDEYHQAVLAQANYLGMDPEGDADFLWYVLQPKQPLPARLAPKVSVLILLWVSPPYPFPPQP